MRKNQNHSLRIPSFVIKNVFRPAAAVSIIILLPVIACGAEITLAWDANTEDDLKGYIIYYGASSRNYSNSIDVGDTTQYTISDLQEGVTYYMAAKAYDYEDNQSGFSAELVHTIADQSSQNRNPDTPSTPSGPSSGFQQTSYSFSTSAVDPDEDPLEYNFDWGDGAISGWGSTPRSHSWSSSSSFCVRAQARDSYGAFSDWSNCHTINITENTHTIAASANTHGSITPSGSILVTDGSTQTFTISPDQDHQILDVQVDGASLGAVNSYTFNNITRDHAIIASFVHVDPVPAVDDSDEDGVPDDQDAFPLDPSETLDSDRDGVGNNADDDDDNDGMPDAWETLYGLNPLKDDASEDPDGDNVSNLNEYHLGSKPNFFEGNSDPDPPMLITPSAHETVNATPILQADAFYDPDHGDLHAESQWRIFRAEDNFCVFDVRSSTSLTLITVPKLVLEEDTAYKWQVRFIDNHGTPSDWSEFGYFTTEFSQRDADGNGIPDYQEVDDLTDLDRDGILDKDQVDIKCVKIVGKNTMVGVSIKGAENIVSIESVESENPDDIYAVMHSLNKPIHLPFGLINFKLMVSRPGAETVITIYLSEPASIDGKWYKYDPVNNIWMDYSDFTELGEERKSLRLELVDGGFGDADGTENGIIVDPLAFGTDSAIDINPSTSDSDNDGNSLIPNVSCFISTVADKPCCGISSAIWRELSGRELSILFVLMVIAYIAKAVFLKIKSYRKFKLGRKGGDSLRIRGIKDSGIRVKCLRITER